MRRLIVLKSFTEFVPGHGIVVGNPAREESEKRPAREASIVSLPAEMAESRVKRGYAEYADDRGENETDVPARPLSQRDKRLAARAARRGEAQEVTGDGTGEALPPASNVERTAPAREPAPRKAKTGKRKGARKTAAKPAAKPAQAAAPAPAPSTTTDAPAD